ncbi:Xaa-Pro peptidase family protein [Aneurinibacillus sp. Ricciae_BoGa-3]|uniref:M24 family metallopeptidase n=1 Tax=Aneurinibacillus sp. Ricciae_BoGa-3 TaxID=3022697 RepID=UPI00234038AB|nr:Xaa-Pro peptidase family protein [Aneurinibacillus sp. Ricciae_BoGa-3]WCK53157.1 Xaa-Pro peptidase family protein [Aneurinibacillus sp. Ricciae_BoGa-3]
MAQRAHKLQAVLQEKQLDALLITSGFNRRYLSGFTGTSGFCLVTKENAELITDFRYIEQAQKQAPDFEIIRHKRDILDAVAERAKHHNVKRLGFEKNHITYGQYQRLQNVTAGIELADTEGLVEELRLIKTAEEITVVKQAAEIADKTFSHILSYIKPGITELQVSNEMEMVMRSLGASSSSFDTIVASGLRSALPHGVASDKVIEQGDMVTLDFGAYYKGYVSDITRTIAVGEPGEKLREIYSVVLKAQLNGVKHFKAGITGIEADALTRDIIKDAGYGEYFGHSTGHGIGLEVHEGPALSMKGDTTLKPGMIVTCEPGIYIANIGGVRIEDDVVITDNGCEILTSSPKDLIVL